MERSGSSAGGASAAGGGAGGALSSPAGGAGSDGRPLWCRSRRRASARGAPGARGAYPGRAAGGARSARGPGGGAEAPSLPRTWSCPRPRPRRGSAVAAAQEDAEVEAEADVGSVESDVKEQLELLEARRLLPQAPLQRHVLQRINPAEPPKPLAAPNTSAARTRPAALHAVCVVPQQHIHIQVKLKKS